MHVWGIREPQMRPRHRSGHRSSKGGGASKGNWKEAAIEAKGEEGDCGALE